MKTTLIISIVLFVASSVAAYFNCLYFIPAVIFSVLIVSTLFLEHFLPEKTLLDRFRAEMEARSESIVTRIDEDIDRRLKACENVVKGFAVAKAMGKKP